MKGKKSRFLILGILAVLLVSTAVGAALGKYVTTVSYSGTVTFTAELAKNVTLQEHTAHRNADGKYTLSNTLTTGENSYVLLPGLDIPKDPYITIEEKTPLAAYLFLVVDRQPEAETGLLYTLEECWVPVAGYANVYVYSDTKGPVSITDETVGLDAVGIIKNDKVYVSQKLDKTMTEGKLGFSAVLKEIGDPAATPEQVYGR